MSRENGIIQTFMGKGVSPLDPKPDQIDIRDIAHALSNTCRFAGHTSSFYSVAQHSVILSAHLPEELSLCGLLHDSAEAYLTDIPRPYKHLIPGYKEIEQGLLDVIAVALNCPDLKNLPPIIKELDAMMFGWEARDLMGISDMYTEEAKALIQSAIDKAYPKMKCWGPEESKRQFMQAYTRYKK